jgi:hypothetical protein
MEPLQKGIMDVTGRYIFYGQTLAEPPPEARSEPAPMTPGSGTARAYKLGFFLDKQPENCSN